MGYAFKIDGTIDANLDVSIHEVGLQKTLNYWGKNVQGMDNNPKHTNKKAKKAMILRSFCGLLNPPNSIPLRICGVISRGSLQSVRNHL